MHETGSPVSAGCISAFILGALDALEIHEGVVFDGEILDRHVSWANGVGTDGVNGRFDQLGTFCRLLTGKGTGSAAAYDKHRKQMEALAIVSFCKFPPKNAFGDAAVDLCDVR